MGTLPKHFYISVLVFKLSFPPKLVTVSLVSVVSLHNRSTNVQFNKCVKEQGEPREAVSRKKGVDESVQYAISFHAPCR